MSAALCSVISMAAGGVCITDDLCGTLHSCSAAKSMRFSSMDWSYKAIASTYSHTLYDGPQLCKDVITPCCSTSQNEYYVLGLALTRMECCNVVIIKNIILS